VTQTQRRRVDARLARAAREVGREGERAVDRGEPQARDELQQPLGLADSDGHDGGARGLQRHMVGDPAGVERIVQAVRDDVVAAHARDGEGRAADGRVRLVVGAGQADGHRVSRRARRHVQAHQRLGRCAQVLAERRPRGLGRAQVGLGEQRDVLERPRAGEALAIEGRAALQIGELSSQRRGVGHGAHASRPATRRAARWAARRRDASGGECRVRWEEGAEPARFLVSLCDARYAARSPPSSAARTIFPPPRG
jgi:hypothetical protein